MDPQKPSLEVVTPLMTNSLTVKNGSLRSGSPALDSPASRQRARPIVARAGRTAASVWRPKESDRCARAEEQLDGTIEPRQPPCADRTEGEVGDRHAGRDLRRHEDRSWCRDRDDSG